eukprot:5697888-Lingulodinium_polyedra.AAC.1
MGGTGLSAAGGGRAAPATARGGRACSARRHSTGSIAVSSVQAGVGPAALVTIPACRHLP